LTDNTELEKLKAENVRLKKLLNIQNKNDDEKIDISDLIDIEQLKILFEKFSTLTGWTIGFVKQDTREILISTGWTDICKKFHRGTKSSEYICMESNKELTKNLQESQEISLKECQHGMVDGATPIIIDGEHLADLFSGQVLFHKPNIEDFQLGADKYGYDMEKYLEALDKVKITSKEKLKDTLEFLSFIANLIAQSGKEKKEYIKLNKVLEQKVSDRTREKDILLSLFDKGDSVLFKWNNDENWSVDYVSLGVSTLLEYEVDDFLTNKILYANCIHKDDLQNVIDEVQLANKSTNDFFKHKSYRVITKTGAVKWVSDYTVIIKNNGIITHYLGYINDITHEKKRDQLLNERSKLASMGEMIGNIAHQWRQPLSIISTASTGMQLQKEYNILTDEIFNEACNKINENVQYLSQTIDDFRDFIKDDKVLKDFKLNDNIDSFYHLMQASAKDNEINIKLDIQNDIITHGSSNELQQCFINLFNNSKDAFISNNISEKLIFISAKQEKENIVITFKDNANGIDEKIINKIFEPYFTTKHQYQGTGLGLSMTYKIITESFKATIEVKNTQYSYMNKQYKGAEFVIKLPKIN